MDHVMLDLETMGKGPNAAVVEIGACRFDPTEGTIDLKEVFLRRIAWDDICKYGKTDGSTISWWLIQSSDARQLLLHSDRYPARHAVTNFCMFFGEDQDPDTKLWGKGPTFDITILQNLCLALGFEPWWDHRAERCVRTVIDLAGTGSIKYPRVGVAHNGADDAIFQAVQIIHAYGELGKGKGITQELCKALVDAKKVDPTAWAELRGMEL